MQADGGALCSTGHLMVAVAAREFSVPVVGVAGTFTLTPLFAHNQVTPSYAHGSTLDTGLSTFHLSFRITCFLWYLWPTINGQREALGALLSPAAVLAYDALDPAAFGATEVRLLS